MMLYDVFYYGQSFDSSTALPNPSGDIEYARNTNWDGHVLRPVKMPDGKLVWAGGIVTLKLYAPQGLSLTSPEGQERYGQLIKSLTGIVASKREFAWEYAGTITLLADEAKGNARIADAAGWSLRSEWSC